MNNFLEKIAIRLGAGELFQKHGHHISRMRRVVLVGGVGVIWQAIVFEIFGLWLGVFSPSTATLIGAECAIISNFLLNERFNFRESSQASPFYKRIFKFHLVSSGSLATQYVCIFVAEGIPCRIRYLFFAAKILDVSRQADGYDAGTIDSLCAPRWNQFGYQYGGCLHARRICAHRPCDCSGNLSGPDCVRDILCL